MSLGRNTLSGKRITVMGAARSGIDVALLLSRAGGSVFLSEMADQTQKTEAASLLQAHKIAFEFGGHTDRIFEAEAIVLSPGIAITNPLVQEAQSRKIEVLGELEVASWFCQGKIVAITGSNGKSTTTALLGEMVKQSGISGVVAGNIGTTLSSQVEQTDEHSIAVIEVSNFQLETIRDFHPNVALFLNLTPDHLDRHGSFEEYGKIKTRIFENQTDADVAIYHGQDQAVASLMTSIKSQSLQFQMEDPNTDGAFVQQNHLTVRWQNRLITLCDVREMGMPGPHNVSNGLAASLAAICLGIPEDAIVQTLKAFRGLPHRLELVREVNGVRWYNDSKATNVDSMQCALESFENPVVLIAGGRDKDSDFSTIKALIQKHTRSVILIGEASDKMERSWQGASTLIKSNSFEEAIEQAKQSAQSEDVVLLSPGCASFDMFENFEDRGNQFKTMVQAL